jgi:predicted nucleotidyltransferase
MDPKRLKKRIVKIFKAFEPEKIILFGSRARDKQDQSSDIDVIVVYHTSKAFLDRLRELYLAWDIPRAVDILAYTPEEFERMTQESSFIQDALRHGEILYERG